MHDLKTPLTSLLGYARSLQSFGDDESLRQEAAQVIADEAKHVNSLLDALLTLDQIEFGGRPEEALCDATQVVRLACEACKPQLEAKAIRLQLQCPEQGTVAMSSDDLHRCLGNVLDNALRHSPEGGEISVGVSVEGGLCIIEIGDEGPGIASEHLGRVTERFYRVDAARNRALGGHGLGLAIVKEMLSIYGAEVRFTNRQPHGLGVRLIIPTGQLNRP